VPRADAGGDVPFRRINLGVAGDVSELVMFRCLAMPG